MAQDIRADDPFQTVHGRWMDKAYKPGLVSVIVPTYNRAKFLAMAIKSVLEQTYRPIELLICDDGSTDNTSDFVRKAQEQCDTVGGLELRYLRQENQGAPVARNLGLIHSEGEYIQFLDSDDLLTQEKIPAQVSSLQRETTASVAYGPWRCVYGVDRLVPGFLRQREPEESDEAMLRGYLSTKWFCPPLVYLFRRCTVRAVGPWDESVRQRQDADYLVRVLLNRCHMIYVEGAESYYRRHGGDHIGHPARPAGYFDSLCYLARKWHVLLAKRGVAANYHEETMHHVSTLRQDALAASREDYLRKVQGLADDILGPSYVLPTPEGERVRLAYFRRLFDAVLGCFLSDYQLTCFKDSLLRRVRG